MFDFLWVLRSGRVLLMDGAMGTQLQRMGLHPSDNAAMWNLTHPRRVSKVHDAYAAAGADVLLTNTFMVCHSSVEAWLNLHPGLGLTRDQVWAATRHLMESSDRQLFHLAAIGPVAGMITSREFDDLDYLWHCRYLDFAYGLDALLLETCSTPRVRLAIQRIRGAGLDPYDPPPDILLSLTYRRDDSGRIQSNSGHSPQWFASRAASWGVAALGVNCGRDIGLDDILAIVRQYRDHTDLPIFARPNAGTRRKVGKRWIYPLTPRAFADRAPELLEAGVCMIGGCCGTTPRHIAALRPVVDGWNRARPSIRRQKEPRTK
jgi:methionine synthase I (cobalamin-dependent)